MEFFKELAEAPLPVSIYQGELIDQVRSYVSAGLVEANLPNETAAYSSAQAPGRVVKITRESKRELKKYLKRPSWC